MINVTITEAGLADLDDKVNKWVEGTVANTVRALRAAVILLEGQAREMILQGPTRSGVIYFRGGKQAQRSAPGEPAKSDTGNLQSSLRWHQTKNGSVAFGYLNNIAPYGQYLEDPNSKNRPVLVPTTEQNWLTVTRLLTGALSGDN